MANALQSSGANPGKQTKAAPIYTGRFFSGINTNRSPLRDARGSRYEEKFIGPAGDALIDGSNLEVTNKLTIGRRPGNPIYDTVNEWQNILSFDTFRISKALNDAFGQVTEEIFVMVNEGPDVGGYEPGNASLSAINSAFQKQVGDISSSPAVWESASPSAGQTYGIQVGNEWYFGNGVDNKKWLQSLFVRSTANNSTDLPINTYPFMSTFYVDSNNYIQQLIGAVVQSANQNPPDSPSLSDIYIKSVGVSDNVLTITTNAAPYNPGSPTPIPIGTQYIIWSSDNGPSGQFGVNGSVSGALAFLQGMTVTTLTDWTAGGGGYQITSAIDWPNLATTNVTQTTYPDFATLQIINGAAATVNNTVLTGTSVPTWSTQVPSASNNFGGGITFDGQAIWVNRGETVENWGIAAPTGNLATPGDITTFGAAAGNWTAGTYYAPASIATASDGNLWMVTTPGLNPAGPLPTSPTRPAKKYDIYTVEFQATPGHVIFGTEHVGTGVSIGDVFQVSRLRVLSQPANATACNTPPLILGTNLTFVVTAVSNTPSNGASSFITATCAGGANFPTGSGAFGDAGYMWLLPQAVGTTHAPDVYPVSPTRGQAQWTYIQSAASLTWAANTHYYEDDFVSNGSNWMMLYKGVQPFIHSMPVPANAAPQMGRPGNVLNRPIQGSTLLQPRSRCIGFRTIILVRATRVSVLKLVDGQTSAIIKGMLLMLTTNL